MIQSLIELIRSHNGINNKQKLASIVCTHFNLTQDRSVYYTNEFAIRFCSAAAASFSNTVLSLSALHKYDNRPFIVCVVTPHENFLQISNSTFLKKVSHSSQELRINNIRGSFNGSDIYKTFNSIHNCSENIVDLYKVHEQVGFDANLPRLVEATNNIVPTGTRFSPNYQQTENIRTAPIRALNFINSPYITQLKEELDEKVRRYKDHILIAGFIENVNVRGRVIEYLIAGEDERLRQEIIFALSNNMGILPEFRTENALGDYSKNFFEFNTETDIKTKILILDSNPKAYNLDKILEFLSLDNSVFMIYFIGIEPRTIVNTVLVSMFQEKLLSSTILLKHWAGRNSRGVSQFEGNTIKQLILSPESTINIYKATSFLKEILAL